jgi:hypothetical protein
MVKEGRAVSRSQIHMSATAALMKSLTDLGDPSSFGMDTFSARSFHVNVRVIACQRGGLAYKGSAIVVEVPIHVGNKSPEVVDAIDTAIGGFEKDQGDDAGEPDEIVVGGLSIDGEEECLGCGKG